MDRPSIALWQQMLLNLSHCVARQFFDRDEFPRDLEGSQFGAAADLDLRRIQRQCRDDIGDRHFAARAIRQAHYSRLGDLWLLLQKLFDLAWIDVEATRNDQIALASGERIVTIGRAGGEI